MRIIAGQLKGRTFDSPKGHRTHPMSDKMRGALFAMLGDIEDLTVLDAFAGSGALSFEAISRGAASALAIDADISAQRAIAENIAKLGLEQLVKMVRASANAWLGTNEGASFDLVLCDPPYDNLQESLIARLAHAVRTQGLLVLSWPGAEPLPQLEGLKLEAARRYGDSQLGFYRA